MRELPSGTVTLLFTDIEGSTRLLDDLGTEAYAAALAEHRRLVRGAFERHSGVEVDTEGDAFFVAFQRASDAIAAAASAQRALADPGNGLEGRVHVRVGIHTGEPLLTDSNYVGIDVHRAARVMAAGHGGQVLLSHPTRELVGQELPDGVSLRDLGEHRLKDLTLPQRIFQLCVQGLPADFPPLKTLENRPTNLPAQPTPLVGRTKEEDELIEILLHQDVRLLTLTGPGGTGKTRLALQVAADLVEAFRGGVFFVSLAAVTDPALVLPAIAQTIGLRERPGQPLAQALRDYLGGKEMLLLLDNFEQVVDAAQELADLLASAPALRLLVTSRAPLRLPGEREYEVPPLALPDPGRTPTPETLSQYEAVRLFVERAQAVVPAFRVTNENAPAIAEICARLDGLPLALELAAARVRVLPPRALLDRLENRLKVLTGGARGVPERQQTLRAAIDWSYELLSDDEKALFARLSVFAGGWTLDAAQAVCDGDGEFEIDVLDGLATLVEKSLVRQEERDGEARFGMLETIREYAGERLDERRDADDGRDRHAVYFLEFIEETRDELPGRDEEIWLRRWDSEQENFRSALAWFLELGDAERALRLVGALMVSWYHRGRYSEGRRWAQKALALPRSDRDIIRLRALRIAGELALEQGDMHAARELLDDAFAIANDVGDPEALSVASTVLAHLEWVEENYARARELYEFSLELDRAALENSAALDSRTATRMGTSLNNVGWAALWQGDLERARASFDEALVHARANESKIDEAMILNNLARAAIAEGDYDDARDRLRESVLILRTGPEPRILSEALDLLARVEGKTGDACRTACLVGASEAIRAEVGLAGFGDADLREREEAVAAARADPNWNLEWEKGRSMTAEDAVDYALEAARENR